jgi:serine/threonine protein kinase
MTQDFDHSSGIAQAARSSDDSAYAGIIRAIGSGDRTSIGGRSIVRRLSNSIFGRRYLALDARREVDCMVWLFDGIAAARMPAVWTYLKKSVGERRTHVLPIDAAGRERGGVCWAVTPYVGNHEGIVSLESLRRARGGAMTVFETGRAVEQLLDASSRCHEAGLVHGEILPQGVLVTPRGTLEIAMYGLANTLREIADVDESRGAEVRSIASIGWQLLTGTPDAGAESDRQQAGAALRAWLRRASDPVDGFESAGEALAALPETHSEVSRSRLDTARSILGKLGSVVGVAKSGRDGIERKNEVPSGVGAEMGR